MLVPSATSTENYLVERSINGVNFLTLGNVAAVLNKLNYRYNDAGYANLTANKVFYRIKGISNAGQPWYSTIARVDKNDKNPVTIFATASGNSADIRISNLTKGNYSLSILANDGRLIGHENINITQPIVSSLNKQMEMNAAGGLYFIILRNEAGDLITKKSFLK